MADGFATLLMLLLPAALVYVYFATHIASRSSCIDLASAVAYRAAYSYTYTRVAQLKYSRLARLSKCSSACLLLSKRDLQTLVLFLSCQTNMSERGRVSPCCFAISRNIVLTTYWNYRAAAGAAVAMTEVVEEGLEAATVKEGETTLSQNVNEKQF